MSVLPAPLSQQPWKKSNLWNTYATFPYIISLKHYFSSFYIMPMDIEVYLIKKLIWHFLQYIRASLEPHGSELYSCQYKTATAHLPDQFSYQKVIWKSTGYTEIALQFYYKPRYVISLNKVHLTNQTFILNMSSIDQMPKMMYLKDFQTWWYLLRFTFSK